MRHVVGSDSPRPGPRPILARLAPLAPIVAAVLLIGSARIRLAGIPLERDEGEYAYAAQLILQGIPPYQQVYNMKFPGTYYAYSVILGVLGSTPAAIRWGLLIVNIATIVPIFLIVRRLADDLAASVAGASFVFLSAGTSVLGLFAHATHFVILPAMFGFWLLLRALDSSRWPPLFWSGVLLGLAVLMKQHAIVFVLFGAWLAFRSGAPHSAAQPAPPPEDQDRTAPAGPSLARRVSRAISMASGRRLVVFGAGAAAPLVLICGLFALQGVLGQFWFWTFGYAREYVTEQPLASFLPALPGIIRGVTRTNSGLWALAVLGAGALWILERNPLTRIFVAGLVFASFLGTCPGFYFRPHYFILMTPAVAMLVGIAADSARHFAQRLAGAAPAAAAGFAIAVFGVAAGVGLVQQREILFTMLPARVSRAIYDGNPFPEMLEVGRYIRERSEPKDRIAVLGSEPEVYFYARRLSATGYVYTYPLMEPQKYASWMQREMIREIEATHPAYLVDVRSPVSWLVRSESDGTILEWQRRYETQCYDVVGIAEILPGGSTSYLWDDQIHEETSFVTGFPILVFRRNSAADCAVGVKP